LVRYTFHNFELLKRTTASRTGGRKKLADDEVLPSVQETRALEMNVSVSASPNPSTKTLTCRLCDIHDPPTGEDIPPYLNPPNVHLHGGAEVKKFDGREDADQRQRHHPLAMRGVREN
jgi:hypothetical protein